MFNIIWGTIVSYMDVWVYHGTPKFGKVDTQGLQLGQILL